MRDINRPGFWETIYRQGKAPWDLGQPAPVFRRLRDNGALPPGRMIVLGAGLGHDARLFARHDFQVTAVDFAHEAVAAMHRLADTAAPIVVMEADLFDLPPLFDRLFDYVLEYVCYCAIDPSRRGAYADVVRDLLRPDGRYVALAFPIEDRDGGPPFSVDPDEMIALFRERGFTLERREDPVDSVPSRNGREELLILQKGAA